MLFAAQGEPKQEPGSGNQEQGHDEMDMGEQNIGEVRTFVVLQAQCRFIVRLRKCGKKYLFIDKLAFLSIYMYLFVYFQAVICPTVS